MTTLDWQGWMQAVAALGAVLLLIWGAARALRASPLAAGGQRPGRRLRVEEVLALDPRRRLLLLRCDEREVLLVTGGAQDLVIGWLPPDPPA